MAAVLRIVTLSFITLVVAFVSWQLASAAGDGRRLGLTAGFADAEPIARVDPAARGLVEAARTSSLAGFPDSRSTSSGAALVLGSGVPFTVLDAGRALPSRAPRGASLADAVTLAGVTLGPLDEIVSAKAAATVAPGDVLRVYRITETEVVVRESIPFGIRTVGDPTLPAGRVAVGSAGAPGAADNTYRIRSVDGAEAGRTLVSTVTVQDAVDEVRRVGTRPPPGPGEIVAIIRQAAATWGADPDQLLRVAYCESHYNPNAYNASSGASGLFQFLPRTWAANSVRAGYGGASVFDPVANANTAAYMFSVGQAGQWSCK